MDEMDLVAWYALWQPSEHFPLTEALNGGPTCWDRPNGGLWNCPCHPSDKQNQIRESFAPGAGKDEKIAAVVAGHRMWLQRSSEVKPEGRKHQESHARYIVISDHEDFEGQGVLVGEITEDGSDIILVRVAVADVVEVLVSKAQGHEVASALSEPN